MEMGVFQIVAGLNNRSRHQRRRSLKQSRVELFLNISLDCFTASQFAGDAATI